MKIQDVLFLIIFAGLIVKTNYKWLVSTGLISLVLSIPLFYFWVFFTAQKLLEYSFFFFIAALVVLVIREVRKTI